MKKTKCAKKALILYLPQVWGTGEFQFDTKVFVSPVSTQRCFNIVTTLFQHCNNVVSTL